MAGRVQQDLFIDDDDESWLALHPSIDSQLALCISADQFPTSPLCVEELDLSDKNFRPCPCGYQVRRTLHL